MFPYVCTFQVWLKGLSQGLRNIIQAREKVEQWHHEIISRLAALCRHFWAVLLAKIWKIKRHFGDTHLWTVQINVQINEILIFWTTWHKKLDAQKINTRAHTYIQGCVGECTAFFFFTNYSPENITLMDVGLERYKTQFCEAAFWFLWTKAHWKMSRLPNLTHVNRTGEQKALWSRRGRKIHICVRWRKRDNKKTEKETDFKAPGCGIHSTRRQEVKRKGFWQGVLVGVAVWE